MSAESIASDTESPPQTHQQRRQPLLRSEASNPTTKAELWGWYGYSWAAEPFIVSAVGTYVPILLEQFAREKGVRLEDHTIPCLAPTPPANGTLPLPPGVGDPNKTVRCVVEIVGHIYIDTSSFALYTFSLSVLVQTLVVISMSGAADRGKFRKKLIVWFASVGALATCCFLFVSANHYLVPALLAIISNSCFGAVTVCGNAYLPVLVKNHPEILEAVRKSTSSTGSSSQESSPLLLEAGAAHHSSNPFSHPDVIATTSKISSQISGFGVAIGYFAALIVQISTILLVSWLGSTTFSLKLAIFFVGVWWLVFQVPVQLWLRSRPGPPLPKPVRHQRSSLRADGKHKFSLKRKINHFLMHVTNGGHAYIIYGWKTLLATFKEARQMKDVALFLLAWFLISDAATTINSAAILFARTEFQMSAPSLAVIGVLVVISGIAGATIIPKVIVPRLLTYTGGNPVVGMSFVVLLASLIPAYGVLGFYTKHLGLRSPWEMYLLAVWYGFALGGLNTLCRSIFSMLIPQGKESTFFSLFSVTDKGSSVVGPLVSGIIVDRTHDIRYTFYFLLFLMVLPLVVFYNLDIERGSKEALYLETIEALVEEDDQ